MDDNCRPLEHFIFFFFFTCNMDSKLKTCTKQTDKVFISPSTTPSLLLLSLLLFQLLCRVKGKGSENMVIYLEEGSHRISALTFKARGQTRVWLQDSGYCLYSYICFVFVIWYIIFCLCKTGPQKKKKTTQHITSFLCFCLFFFVLFCFTKTSGEETMFLHNCLLQNATSVIQFLSFLFNTVGYETLTMSSWWTLVFTQETGSKHHRYF